jgi:hypothetical protein
MDNKVYVVTESYDDYESYESWSYDKVIGIFSTLKKAKTAIEKYVVDKWKSLSGETYNDAKFKWNTEFCYNWTDEENYNGEYNFFIEEQEIDTMF